MKIKINILSIFILIFGFGFLFSNSILPTPLNFDMNKFSDQMIEYIRQNPEKYFDDYEKTSEQEKIIQNLKNSNRDEIIKVTCPVILVHFPDNNRKVESSFFDNMLNNYSLLKSNYPNTKNVTSQKEYYLEESNFKIEISFDIIEWIMLDKDYVYYTNGEYGFGSYPHNTFKMFEDIIDKIDSMVDFSKYDMDNNGYIDFITIIHSGQGQEMTGNGNDMWSHKTSKIIETNDGVKTQNYSVQPEYFLEPYDGAIGVFVHEFGHLIFGFKDLYDTDYSSFGIGDFGLMSFGSWGQISGHRDGSSPTPLSQYNKLISGFEDLKITITNKDTDKITIKRGEIIKIKHPYLFREYLLIYYQKKTPYSDAFPLDKNNIEEGLIIEHIDENMSNNTNEWYPPLEPMSNGRYLVQIKQKDGLYDLEKMKNKGQYKDRFLNEDYLIHNNDTDYGIDFNWYYNIKDEEYLDITKISYDSILDEYTLYFNDNIEPPVKIIKPYKILVFKNKFNEYYVLIKTKDNSIPIFESETINENDFPNYFKMENNIYFYLFSEYEINNLSINEKKLIEYLL